MQTTSNSFFNIIANHGHCLGFEFLSPISAKHFTQSGQSFLSENPGILENAIAPFYIAQATLRAGLQTETIILLFFANQLQAAHQILRNPENFKSGKLLPRAVNRLRHAFFSDSALTQSSCPFNQL